MRRLLALWVLTLPAAASAQWMTLRPPSLAESFQTLDRLQARQLERKRDGGLDQIFVVPERPGQNQVAWYGFDWEYVDVPAPGGGKGGIRLYYYRSELDQARRALPAIESAFARLVDAFHYNPTKRIPYFLYATQREFQTQNIFAVTESVLGVTSPQDLKMTVPYFGDHSRFIEVSTHEMVHQFTIQKLNDQADEDEMASAIHLLPLWFIEGIAEYYSKGGIDVETDLYLRDLIWNPDPRRGYEIPSFADDRIKSYVTTYKLGQARIAFIAEEYGREKIQGLPMAARAIITPSQPVCAFMRSMSAAVFTSPFPMTGTFTACFTSAIASQSAWPRYAWLRVRPSRGRNPRSQHTDEQRNQRGRDSAAQRGDDGRPRHYDDEARGRQRRQFLVDSQQPGQDESDRAQHFRDSDEPQERSRQRHRHRERLDRHDELHDSGEQKQSREQPLHNPQQHVTFRHYPAPSALWSNGMGADRHHGRVELAEKCTLSMKREEG